ncbi:MAG: xanthine dehydrogenase family protein molybdopterin-binding subunit [Gemmatimonadales bacterium]
MPRNNPPATLGTNVRRLDGPAKVSGTADYPQDLAVPTGCLHLATVRAPVAAGRIERLDPARALATAGVVRVLTAADVRGTNRFGLSVADQPVLASREVRGASDVVALVVATSERAAREGARRVDLSVTPTPLLLDPARACERGAPTVHPERRRDGRHPNLFATRCLHRGDPDGALAGSAVVVESEYRTGMVEHAFLAPEAGLATPDGSGGFVLQVSTQWPEVDIRQAAKALGEPVDRLRIIQTTIGGAFGGREDISLQILLLLAAQHTGRPVRMVWSRAESVRGHGKRHPFSIRHRLGADTRGRLTAASIEMLIDAGCYASTSAQLLDNAIAQATGPYRIANTMIAGRAVFTHNPYTCAFRGFGVNQVAFAMEQQINKLAAALGRDPVELRRLNLVRGRAVLGSGSTVAAGTMALTTLAAAARGARRRRPPPPNGRVQTGRGFATAIKNYGFGFGGDDRATAEVIVGRDGARIRIGAADVGQGTETILAQIAADALGLPLERIRVEWRDTGLAPEAGSASASRLSLFAGNAVALACRRARRAVAGPPMAPGTERIYRASYRSPGTSPLATGATARHATGYGWSSCVADVAVDVDTGVVSVARVVTAIDAGRVIHPAMFEGQVEGGVVMGQGYALQEQCPSRDGIPRFSSFERCGVPTAIDAVPRIEIIPIETGSATSLVGARGIGEITMIPVVPAITAAIYDACGVWIDELPASPERVRAAIASRHEALGRQIPQ